MYAFQSNPKVTKNLFFLYRISDNQFDDDKPTFAQKIEIQRHKTRCSSQYLYMKHQVNYYLFRLDVFASLGTDKATTM